MIPRSFLVALVGGLAMLTAGAATAEARMVEGTVTYLDRRAVPPGAVVEVEVLDVSRADAPSVRMSSQRFLLTGVPFAFSLPVDAALIDDRFTYTVAAKILVEEKVIYRSTTAYPVLTRGAADTAEVIVDRMPAQSAQATGAMSVQGDWIITEIAGAAPVSEKSPTISFLPEGRVGVFTGCNRFMGAYDAEADEIEFPETMAGTLMACPEPVMEQEKTIMGLLRDVETIDVQTRSADLKAEDGTLLLRLARAK